jgi:hypothetical protein
MKKLNITGLVFITVFTLSSCGRIFMRVKGLNYPHFETTEHIDKIISKYAIPKEKIIYGNSADATMKSKRLFKNSPGVSVINSDGYLNVYQQKNVKCAGPIDNYLPLLCNLKPDWIDSTTYEDTLVQNFHYADGRPFDYKQLKGEKRIYLSWAVYQNKELKKVRNFDQLVSDLKDCKYPIIWINGDFMAKEYGYNRRKKIKTDFNVQKGH